MTRTKTIAIVLIAIGGTLVFYQLLLRYEVAEIGVFDVRRDRLTGEVAFRNAMADTSRWTVSKDQNYRRVKVSMESRTDFDDSEILSRLYDIESELTNITSRLDDVESDVSSVSSEISDVSWYVEKIYNR